MSEPDIVSATSPSARTPERLRRGVRIVERTDGRLQVGYLPRHAVLPRPPRPMRGGVRLVGDTPWRSKVADALLSRDVPVLATAEVAIALADGEHDRTEADLRLLADLPTLHVAVIDSRVRVGPFTVPGVTACLRCVDAHATQLDPGHAAVLEAYQQPGPTSEPFPAALHWAIAWLVNDVARWLSGWQPTTWSSIVWCDETSAPTLTWVDQHPWCGCSWPTLWRRTPDSDVAG